MGEVTITQKEYRELVECRLKLKMVKDYVENEDFASVTMVSKIIGKIEPEKGEEDV